jgi:uncharacterized protein (TIGR02284 family)
MGHNEIVSTLNNLIEISNDGKEGFKTCAENGKFDSLKIKGLLIEEAQRCKAAAGELSDLVYSLGGTPATGTTASGALHRGWLNVKTAITGKNDRTVLEECERGQDVAKFVYQEALAKGLPEPIRATVERQYKNVLQSHDLIKELRNEARAAEHT